MFTRRLVLQGLATSALLPAVGHADTPAETASIRQVEVPVDHSAPDKAGFPLDVLVLGRMEPRRPTVFLVGDGQQFYIQPDQMPKFRALFGDGVNIVGIAGRGFAKPLLDRLGDPAAPGADWALAWTLLNFRQWTADIDRVRVSLLGSDGRVFLFGTSGGAYLLHTYLAEYGGHVRGVYSEVAPLPQLEAELHLRHDKFWDELDEADRKTLWSAIAAHPEKRTLYAQLLQRQNYFVDLNALSSARHDLIGAMARDDEAVLKTAATDYQVDALAQMMSSANAWPIRVREYEFVAPVLKDLGWKTRTFRPDVEVSEMWARPLLDLRERNALPMPVFDLARLNAVTAEVLIVCGRYDHISDYREQIAIAGRYRNSRLLILDDDHLLHRLKAAGGLREALLRAWPLGFGDPAFTAAVSALQPLVWQE